MAEKNNKLPSIILLLAFVAITFLALRFFHLHDTFTLGSDEGRDFLVVWDIVNQQKLKLIGPPSEYTWQGQQFFFGPAPYYFIIPALLLGNWNPLSVSYFLIIFNLAVFLIVLSVLDNIEKDRYKLYIFAFLVLFTPALITYTRSYWNPYFTFSIAMLLLSLLLIDKYKKQTSLLFYGSIGFLFGLGMQFHYGFIFAILVTMAWLLFYKRLSIYPFTAIIAGSVLGFLPLVLYDLLTNFSNLKTMLTVFAFLPRGSGKFTFHSFYIISLVPFYIYFISSAFSHFMRRHPRATYLLLGIYVAYSLYAINTMPTPSFPYQTFQKLSSVIQEDHPQHFNIADQLTSDNRAMALRYLLTSQGSRPLGVTEYEQANTLYVYSRVPIAILQSHPIWEIASFRDATVKQTWNIEDGVFLYKLEK